MVARRLGLFVALLMLLGVSPTARADEDGAEAEAAAVTPEMRDAALKRMFTYLDENLWKLGEGGSTRKPYAAAVAGWAYLLSGEKIKAGKKLPSRKKQLDRIRGYLASYAERVARGYEQSDKREAKKEKKKADKPKGPPGFGDMRGMRTAQYVWSLGQAAHFYAESAVRGKAKSASKKALRVILGVLESAQQENGGWGHDDAQREGMGLPPIQIPKPGGGSLTYPATLLAATNCALSGLGAGSAQVKRKSAREVIDAGKTYLLGAQNGSGTFPYDPSQKHGMRGGGGMAGGIEVARTSGAVLSLYLAGMTADAEPIKKALAAIDKSPEQLSDGHGSAAMALQFGALLAAVRGGAAWDTFRKIYFPKILAKQNKDGSCDCVCNEQTPGVTNDTKPLSGMPMPAGAGDRWVTGGRVYVTAIHALILALDRAAPEAIPPLETPKEKVVTR